MENTVRDKIGAPAVVDRGVFQAELDALRAREKAHTREGDAIAAARRRLPMVEVDGATPLIGERGAVTLFSYRLLDLTVYGRQETWENSPAGWLKGKQFSRIDGRPTAQWSRVKAGYSDDLGTGRA